MSDDKNNPKNTHEDDIVFIDFEQVEEVSRVFFEESQEILEDLDDLILKLEENPEDQEQVNILFRKVHTLKGSVGAVPGGQLVGSLAHEFEALLNRIKRESRPVEKACIEIFLQSSRILKVLASALRDKREIYPEELSEAIELITHYGNFEFSGQTEERPVHHSIAAVSHHTTEEAGVWISSKQLDDFVRISGELLVLKNFFNMMNQTVNFRVQPEVFERRQGDFLQNLTKLSDQFQNQIQTVRKEKVQDSFHGLTLLIRQASTELNKTVHFDFIGGDLPIDKSLGKDLYDCLVHLVRNSIDHGIEDQFERALQGKSSVGNLTLEMAERNGNIEMIFKDDGKGLDRSLILQKAIKSGLTTEEKSSLLSDDEIYSFIFHPGFSTKEKVTTISGRGVGMDIVRYTIDKYKGKIKVHNTPNMGAGFQFIIPIPRHIIVESALLCSWQNFQIAVPLSFVAHISSCEDARITQLGNMRYAQFADQTVAMMNYSEILKSKISLSEKQVKESSAIYIRAQGRIIALLVDKIEAQTDLVVKSFGGMIKAQRGFKGVSILADEKVTYILDPDSLFSFMDIANTEEEAA